MGKLKHVGLVVRGCMVVVGLSGGVVWGGEDMVIYSSGRVERGVGSQEEGDLLSLSILDTKKARDVVPEVVKFGGLRTGLEEGALMRLSKVKLEWDEGVPGVYRIKGLEVEGALFEGEVYMGKKGVRGWKLVSNGGLSPFRAERVFYRDLKYSVVCEQGRRSRGQVTVAEVSPRSMAVAKHGCKSEGGAGFVSWTYRGLTMGQKGRLEVEYMGER